MRRAALACLLALAGCDRVFGLEREPDAPPPPPEWISIAAGTAHTCAVANDRTLWCWGDNGRGQSGLPITTAEITVPTQVGDERWTTVVSGYDHSCAIDTARVLWCWGGNTQNAIGAMTDADHLPLTRVLDDVITVATGTSHTCAIRGDQTLWCWGRNSEGQLGLGYFTVAPTINEPTPKQIMSDLRWTTIRAGQFYTCGITTDRALMCWGLNRNKQVVVSATAAYNEPQPIEPGTEWIDVAVGHQHTCAVRADGTMRCQGFNNHGQIATVAGGTSGDVATGDPARTWTRVFATVDHTCGLRDDLSLWCFGDNGQHALALDMPDEVETPTRVAGGAEEWTDVALGTRHLCGTDRAGVMWCVGTDGSGQLGTGTGGSKPVPIQLAGTWSDVAVGSRSVCARDLTGAVSCWGDNGSGQLGDGSTVAKQRPQFTVAGPVDGALAVGNAHACARTGAGTGVLSCWGDNSFGQLGTNSTITELTPKATSVVDPVQVVASSHTCALNGAGLLYCWGSNSEGQLAFVKDKAAHATPMRVGLVTWSDIAAGSAHTCGVLTGIGGNVECWGDDRRGQRGNDIAVGPGPVMAGATQVAAGGDHTCAVMNPPRLQCWGYNADGQVGDDTLTDRATPQPIGGVTSWAEVTLGLRHTCGLQFEGQTGTSLWCWGDNSRGQLGNGSRTNLKVPTRIGSELWSSVAAGGNETCAIKEVDQTLWCWGANGAGQLGDGSAWSPAFVRIAP